MKSLFKFDIGKVESHGLPFLHLTCGFIVADSLLIVDGIAHRWLPSCNIWKDRKENPTISRLLIFLIMGLPHRL